jgi:hypothetical protein
MSEEENKTQERRPIIDKSSLLPIGFVIAIATFVWFLSGVYSDVQASKIRIDKLEQAIAGINQMSEDIAVIKVQVQGLTKLFAESDVKIR